MSAVKHGGIACEKGGRGGVLLAALAVACSFVLALAFVANAWADEAAPIADDDVFVALYSRDDGGYTLAFQKGDAEKSECGTLEEACSLQDYLNGGPGAQWKEEKRSSVTSAVVADALQPTDTSYWFEGLTNLERVDISKLDTSKVENASNMFHSCAVLKAVDLSRFDGSSLKEAFGMFFGCQSLESLDLSKLNASNLENAEAMFYGCASLKSLDLSGLNTSKVTTMNRMFWDCSSLEAMDLSKFDTAQVTDMYGMFRGCSSLKALDLSKFNTSKVTNMLGMFGECSGLTTLDLSVFDTAHVKNMKSMFEMCSSLKTLDLSRFNMTQVTDSDEMLSGCASLESISLPATGDFAKVGLPGDRGGAPLKWRNENGEVFAADAIPARTAGTYTAVVGDDGSDNDGPGGDNGNGSNGGNSSSGNGNGSGGSTAPAPKRTVAFSEAVALPLDATGVAMDGDDIVRDLAKRFGSREGFPADAENVAVTIMLGGEEVDTIDPRRAGTYEVTAVYSMPDGTERVIEVTYTVADPAAKAPVKPTAKSATRLAQTGDEMPVAVPAATTALAACALAAAVAVRRRARG